MQKERSQCIICHNLAHMEGCICPHCTPVSLFSQRKKQKNIYLLATLAAFLVLVIGGLWVENLVIM